MPGLLGCVGGIPVLALYVLRHMIRFVVMGIHVRVERWVVSIYTVGWRVMNLLSGNIMIYAF